MRVLLRCGTLIAWLITKNSVGCAVFALCASIPLSSAQRSLLSYSFFFQFRKNFNQ
ncbi:hypothetical protein HMPREF3208_00685 [Gardnerella vaginalis]|uniref:Uncharacterized protein n=1 Tax=Gardnerella vaginalis TaxID=2702 RepID=A0A133NXK7_GARVA|nr:hypothetical protein HMPREF3208_00685 [Gardnerella vaginalis]